MITSSSNPRMKKILQLSKKAKTRYEQRVFVAEGIKLCFEAPKEWIQEMYVSESFLLDEANRSAIRGYDYETVSDSVFRAVSDTKTPQGILCLVKMPEYSLEDLLGEPCSCREFEDKQGICAQKSERRPPHLLILESIQDPGNLGTMMRAAEGAGITGILMNKTTADMFHPKTIRSTMGSLFRVPFYAAEDFTGAIHKLKDQGIALYAACLEGEICYDEADYAGPCGFLIGNEGNGLSQETAKLANARVRIPMEGKVESLNAAVAAALLMYEAGRQRRNQRK